MNVTTKHCDFCGESPAKQVVFNRVRYTDSTVCSAAEVESIDVCHIHAIKLIELSEGSQALITACRKALKNLPKAK